MEYTGIAGGDRMPALPQDVIVIGVGVLIAVLIVKALSNLIKQRDPRLLIMLMAGAMACLIESFACYLIRCHHAVVDSYVVYQAFDVHTPLWLAEIYVVYFGAMSFWMLDSKPMSAARFWCVFAAVGALEGIGEMFLIQLGMHEYYGLQPWPIFGFPLYLGFVNAALAASFALVANFWFRNVKGGWQYALPLLTPFIVGGIYASMVGVLAAGLYSENLWAAQVASVVSMAVALVYGYVSQRSLSASNNWSSSGCAAVTPLTDQPPPCSV